MEIDDYIFIAICFLVIVIGVVTLVYSSFPSKKLKSKLDPTEEDSASSTVTGNVFEACVKRISENIKYCLNRVGGDATDKLCFQLEIEAWSITYCGFWFDMFAREAQEESTTDKPMSKRRDFLIHETIRRYSSDPDYMDLLDNKLSERFQDYYADIGNFLTKQSAIGAPLLINLYANAFNIDYQEVPQPYLVFIENTLAHEVLFPAQSSLRTLFANPTK